MTTYDEAYEESLIAAAELVGPNSCEFDAVQRRVFDELCAKYQITEE